MPICAHIATTAWQISSSLTYRSLGQARVKLEAVAETGLLQQGLGGVGIRRRRGCSFFLVEPRDAGPDWNARRTRGAPHDDLPNGVGIDGVLHRAAHAHVREGGLSTPDDRVGDPTIESPGRWVRILGNLDDLDAVGVAQPLDVLHPAPDG